MEAKRISKLFFLCLLGLFLVSCGGGSSSGGGSSNGVPQLNVSMENVNIRRGDILRFSLSWFDSDGDIGTLYIEEWYGPSRKNLSFPVGSQAGQVKIFGNSGTTVMTRTTNNVYLGIYTIKFFVRDAKGQQSNIVEISVTFNAKNNAMEMSAKSSPFGDVWAR